VSGEVLAVVDDYEGKTAKEMKRSLAAQIGIPRFRQKFWSQDWSHEIQDEVVFATEPVNIQLVLSEFCPQEIEEDRKMISASRSNDLGILEKLLQQPRNPNFSDAQDAHGRTPLHHASQYGHVDTIRLLIEARADSNKANTSDGTTPLLRAAEKSHVEIVRVLIEAGADTNRARTSDGTTPLLTAAGKGHVKIVRVLLEARADMNTATTDGFEATPLFFAAQNGHVEIVRVLIEARADSNKARTRDGASCRNCSSAA